MSHFLQSAHYQVKEGVREGSVCSALLTQISNSGLLMPLKGANKGLGHLSCKEQPTANFFLYIFSSPFSLFLIQQGIYTNLPQIMFKNKRIDIGTINSKSGIISVLERNEQVVILFRYIRHFLVLRIILLTGCKFLIKSLKHSSVAYCHTSEFKTLSIWICENLGLIAFQITVRIVLLFTSDKIRFEI